jgi:hypothetical protein
LAQSFVQGFRVFHACPFWEVGQQQFQAEGFFLHELELLERLRGLNLGK